MDGLAATLADGRLRVLRDRRRHRAPERRSCSSLALALGVRVRRLPAVQPAPRRRRARLHGRLGQPGARLRARVARRSPRAGRRPGRRWRPCCCRCSCSRSRSWTRRSSRSCGCSSGGRSTQGGKDHTSHRLVYYGLSERQAVGLLALIAVALGATSLAYNVLDDARVTAVGVLFTFVAARPVRRLPQRPRASDRGADGRATRSLRHAFVSTRAGSSRCSSTSCSICASFLAAYLLVVGGSGHATRSGRSSSAALPVVLGVRYVAFVAVRHLPAASGATPAPRRRRDRRRRRRLGGRSPSGDRRATRPFGDFPRSVFVVDALLCTCSSARLAARQLRLLPDSRGARPRRAAAPLIVGAGRAGRSLAARAARGRAGERVVAFVDDNPRLRGRRIQGVAGRRRRRRDRLRSLATSRPDEVLVTIPDAPRGAARAGRRGVRRRGGAVPLRAPPDRTRSARRPRRAAAE